VILWNDGTNAIRHSRFFVLTHTTQLNGNWQKKGKVYRGIRSLNSLFESSGWRVVADFNTAVELERLLDEFKFGRHHKAEEVRKRRLFKFPKHG
jgi:hypothetical protein